jgi:hypothetical protein
MGRRHRRIDKCTIGHKTHQDRHMRLVPIVTGVYLSVSCAQCYPCLSFCVLCPFVHVFIFLCLESNVTRVYPSVSCAHC